MIREKGIEEAITAVTLVNQEFERDVFYLDIYGPVGDEYREDFMEAVSNSGDCATYCGVVDPVKSVDVLKGYYALLFPTYYEGEGFAGTLIDAMCAGVPVIVSDWKCNGEVVSDDTGIIVKPRDSEALAEALVGIYENNASWLRKRNNCLRAAERFMPKQVTAGLVQRL